MQLAPDFFELFAATARLLDQDPSLYCVSSWNDHGQKQFVADPRRLLRSDFFPGLGWMLTREVWHDIRWEGKPAGAPGRVCSCPGSHKHVTWPWKASACCVWTTLSQGASGGAGCGGVWRHPAVLVHSRPASGPYDGL